MQTFRNMLFWVSMLLWLLFSIEKGCMLGEFISIKVYNTVVVLFRTVLSSFCNYFSIRIKDVYLKES